MAVQDFEEWFAIRTDHNDDAHWTARLRFDLDDGISVSAARFMTNEGKSINSTMNNSTMTGWLDYQRPTTLINPWIQSVGGFSAGVNTIAMREKYTIVADAILKNMFLTNITDAVFSGISVEHPAIHAWLQPDLVSCDWSRPGTDVSPSMSVNVRPARERTFRLADGMEATIFSGTRTLSSKSSYLEDFSTLHVRLANPVCYDQIMRLTWRISTIFEFMIGERTPDPTYNLHTIQTRKWNGDDCEVVAELCCLSSHKATDSVVDFFSTLSSETRSPISIDKILSLFSAEHDSLIYLANLIQSADSHEQPFVQLFGEILGCLEDFDARNYGSGADPEYKLNIEGLARIVKDSANAQEKLLFDRMRNGARNSFSLLKRLERLHSSWSDDGFRGAPNLKRIRDLRNLIPHGKGLQLTSEAAQEIAYHLTYLKALGRYHILKKIGYSGTDIARSFSRKPHRFGMFAPKQGETQQKSIHS